jgi:hypothetical protein
MSSYSLARRVAAGTLIALVTVGLAACAGSGPPSSLGSPPPASPTGSPAMVTIEALGGNPAAFDGQLVTVQGNFLALDGEARLCSALMESFPPQCGGPSIRVVGVVPQAILDTFDRTDDPTLPDAMWGTLRITGAVDADAPDGPALSIVTVELPARD